MATTQEALTKALSDLYDTDNARTAGLRQLQDALALLDVMPHALANGRTEVVREYIERVTAHVEQATQALTVTRQAARA